MNYTQYSGIVLPALEIAPIKFTIGNVRHLIQSGGPKIIQRVNIIVLSARKTEKVYVLNDNQSIMIVSKRIVRPPGVDGVLIEAEKGKLKWLSHRLLDDFAKEVREVGLPKLCCNIVESWSGKFKYKAEVRSGNQILEPGLRPPQLGGLHAIGAHWSVYNYPATLIMPTGTGKTETMLAAFIAQRPGKLLVVVPSRILREQTVNKFLQLGLLRRLGAVDLNIKNPIVGVLFNRPKHVDDFDMFSSCNVIIATMSVLSDESTIRWAANISELIDVLIVDEAHHIAAPTWSAFRENFGVFNKVLQFTATPYRRDGKLVDGRIIFEYPLHVAQSEGYFKKINFSPVYEIDDEEGDIAIAKRAIQQLDNDILAEKDHLIMARCANINRALVILGYYKKFGAQYNPIVIHSEEENSDEYLDGVNQRRHRIIVCVNMLGEGFDLPNLKIAAIHDTHKSLAVLLQFTGRFTRTADETIGEATVIANIANQIVSAALERLYSENADWNTLLSEFSSDAAKSHARLVKFLQESKRLDNFADDDKVEISQSLLRPTFNTLFYECKDFKPMKFIDGLASGYFIQRIWHHQHSNTLYFVARVDLPIRWTRSKNLRDREWHLFVLHFSEKQNLLYLATSDKSSTHNKIAEAVGGLKIIAGDTIFRCLGKINRLIFQQVGVKKHGRRNLRYAMYTGSDVVEALSISERAGSVKSNLSGMGWENGAHITIGCSYKGRVWARDPGTVPELVDWCEHVGEKILDTSINTIDIIANVLIPEEVYSFPDKLILGIDWPIEILKQSEDRVLLKGVRGTEQIGMFDLKIYKLDITNSSVQFQIVSYKNDLWATLVFFISKDGFQVKLFSKEDVHISIGRIETKIEEYFNEYPPLFRFVDLSELDGNLLIKPQSPQELELPNESLESWDWAGVDITLESIIKDSQLRQNSVQWKVACEYIANGFNVVFNDDASGEAADIVALKEEEDCIKLALLHCKFSQKDSVGERISDVVEVASQAVRSAKWKWKFKDLCQHILEREKRLNSPVTGTRFLAGSPAIVNRFAKLSRFNEVKPEIIIIQPGISKDDLSSDQKMVLAAAHSYLKETIGVDLSIICS